MHCSRLHLCFDYNFYCRTTCSMLKNIFRSRRRSKNEPFGDENEPADHTGSLSSKTFFPNNPTATHREGHALSSHVEREQLRNLQPFQERNTENVLSATDVRFQHDDAECINRVASGSQVAGLSGKYDAGHRVGKRRRISSVVNKILMTHSESTPGPRTRRIAASDLYSPEFSTKDQTYKNSGIQASGTCDIEGTDNDSVFAVPYLCQSCASTALPGNSSKTRIRSEDSWMCAQCRMKLTKARERHGSTVSSPAELCTPSVDLLPAVDNSDRHCQPKTKLLTEDSQLDVPSHGKYIGNCNSHCDCGSCGYCTKAIRSSISNNSKFSSADDVTDCDGTPCHKDAASLPSPLRVCDLECAESKFSEDVVDDDGDADDDVIPELVEISPQLCSSSRSSASDAGHHKQHSSPVVQPTAETVNESAMYILTDSFLDDSSASFVRCTATAKLDSSQSAVVGHLPPEVMVADDSEVMCLAETDYVSDASLVVSPHFVASAEKMYHEPDTKAETLRALRRSEEQLWCRKSLSDWSTYDVLHWVVSSGLVQFYDTFRSKLLQITL